MGVSRSVVGSSLYPVNHYVVFLLFNREQGMAGAMDTCRISLGLVIVICQLLAFSHAGGKTLVLLDNALVKESHSIFFASLKGEFICLVLMRFRIHFLFVKTFNFSNKKKYFQLHLVIVRNAIQI